ncbi:three prime repair exonuclease 2 isoform X1 [Podarcis raffonei]|uniref:three prime repair exonuclease 2 isoform X1 n=2 Tax=Podarcis raffonei TaxID=65483 RepID=UPI0023297449|nr:three prime repair exonuclease 2 isoform X1 [Podarcis raffonei]
MLLSVSPQSALKSLPRAAQSPRCVCWGSPGAGDHPLAMAALQDFQTFVFLDLETTGLPHDQPHLAELCLFAVHRRSLQCSPLPGTPQLPRIIDKLTLCVDPQKPFTLEAERITGLSNQNLEENCKADFNRGVVEILKGFLQRQMGPICLVAHNGLGFDFPLLRAELWRVDTDLLPSTGCLDTLPALKELERSPGMSYQLGALFRHFYGREPIRAHSAEGDVVTLLLVFLAKAPELMTWAARNAQSWGEIRPMYLLSRSRN